MGIMSGTSLDGLDLAICSFDQKGETWSYRILYTETVPYTREWSGRLKSAPHLSAIEFQLLDREYGEFIAEHALSAIASCGIGCELIASHGHTVFHQPESGFTCQIGYPQVIAASSGIRTVGNFRELDVLHGGQGAPLVPVGDELLFGEYDYCLNLGGFANISWKEDSSRLARDICPANTVLNHFAGEFGLPFDKGGKAGRSGNVSTALLEGLDSIPYYHSAGPGSLAREWLEAEMMPVLSEFSLPATDILRTLYEHISRQISTRIKARSKVLVSGGGAYNTFLVERIIHHSRCEIVVPDPVLVEFKEALVFAFLGLLRLREETNCYASVTGAERDSCCGVLYTP
jgi:anhydro-N-acetylmuramic acid kinase